MSRKRLDSNWAAPDCVPCRLPLVEFFFRSHRLFDSLLRSLIRCTRKRFCFAVSKTVSVCFRVSRGERRVVLLFLWFNGTRMCVRPELRPNCLSAELSRIYGFAAFLNCAAQVAGAICFPRVLIAESDSDKWRRACRVNGKRHIFHRHQEASTQRAYQHKTSLGGERTISFSCFLFFVSTFQRKAELFRTLKNYNGSERYEASCRRSSG